MINRENYLDVKAFKEYQIRVRQAGYNSVNAQYLRLIHLMTWSDSDPFHGAPRSKMTFQAYLEGLNTPKGQRLGPAYLSAVFKTTRAFLTWVKRQYPNRYKAVEDSWIESMRPSRGRSESAVLKTREYFTLENVLKILELPADTVAKRRNKAAMAFLFLSGMRIGAFLTLPIDCVDLEEWKVYQLPEKGVRTKNSKAAITYLLQVPELREVVKAWDDEIRPALPGTALWYTFLDPWGELTERGTRSDWARKDFREDLVKLCQQADVPYMSPHKFRHGHAVYALKKAKTVAQLKAISQNLMHSNMGITDGIYGRLVNDDVRDIIQSL